MCFHVKSSGLPTSCAAFALQVGLLDLFWAVTNTQVKLELSGQTSRVYVDKKKRLERTDLSYRTGNFQRENKTTTETLTNFKTKKKEKNIGAAEMQASSKVCNCVPVCVCGCV